MGWTGPERSVGPGSMCKVSVNFVFECYRAQEKDAKSSQTVEKNNQKQTQNDNKGLDSLISICFVCLLFWGFLGLGGLLHICAQVPVFSSSHDPLTLHQAHHESCICAKPACVQPQLNVVFHAKQQCVSMLMLAFSSKQCSASLVLAWTTNQQHLL